MSQTMCHPRVVYDHLPSFKGQDLKESVRQNPVCTGAVRTVWEGRKDSEGVSYPLFLFRCVRYPIHRHPSPLTFYYSRTPGNLIIFLRRRLRRGVLDGICTNNPEYPLRLWRLNRRRLDRAQLASDRTIFIRGRNRTLSHSRSVGRYWTFPTRPRPQGCLLGGE